MRFSIISSSSICEISQVHVADPEGKEMFLQLLSTLKDDVAERAADAPPGQLGQDLRFLGGGSRGSM